MPRNEVQTRWELIDPALFNRGWNRDSIKVEENAGAIELVDGVPVRRAKRSDYVLRIEVTRDAEKVAVALIEAKSEDKTPGHGLEQGKCYADCERLNVKFVFSSNGTQFVEYDKFTGITSPAKPMSEFPTPEELRRRYETGMGFSLDSELAKPLLVKYSTHGAQPRYYQDAAIRAVFERIAQGSKRALLSLATGAGKTFIAVNTLKRIDDAGQLRKALFVCDRDELRVQAKKAFKDKFGNNADVAIAGNPQKNARVIIATYHTLGIDKEDGDASFLTENYPPNYFSHIIIDECHRSAWGKWSQVLTRNDEAVQIGLTATPRRLMKKENLLEGDAKITADNLRYFGDPVYDYSMLQAIEDGYLAVCEIQTGRVNIDDTGITIEELLAHNPKNYITGQPYTEDDLKKIYEKNDYEAKLLLPDRIQAMCKDLFKYLIETGTPEQKTIVFCVRDVHAELVASEMNNLYNDWCALNGHRKAENYAFKCTAESNGSDKIADMKGSKSNCFIATTVDLLSTGVDIPAVENIVFFRYMKSPISFNQMVGRGTRLADNKFKFTIYDYTDATRLFGEDFITKPAKPSKKTGGGEPKQPVIVTADGFTAEVIGGERYVVTEVDGKPQRVNIEEYKARLAQKVVEKTPTLEEFRETWIVQDTRRQFIDNLVFAGYSPQLVRQVEEMDDYDTYDIIVNLAFNTTALRKQERANRFGLSYQNWLSTLPNNTRMTVLAIAGEFGKGGTDVLDSRELFNVASVRQAGDGVALKERNVNLHDIKERLFTA